MIERLSQLRLARPAFLRPDPRVYQIAVLSSLLIYGLFVLDFEITIPRAALILSTVLLVQYLCTKLWKLPQFDPKSALISGLSLCLLLRTNSIPLVLICCTITIVTKFAIRWNGKHVFNPTNIGVVAMILLTGSPFWSAERAWVSPGQWGNVAFFAFLMMCLGGLVVNRASRSDVTYAFIASYLGLIFYRSYWLNEPFAIPLHRLENGALLLFTFFMISDPKTTPNARLGRIIFAFLVAYGAYYIQFKLFRTNGLLWSLALFSMFVPIIDWILPGPKYRWDALGVRKPCLRYGEGSQTAAPEQAAVMYSRKRTEIPIS